MKCLLLMPLLAGHVILASASRIMPGMTSVRDHHARASSVEPSHHAVVFPDDEFYYYDEDLGDNATLTLVDDINEFSVETLKRLNSLESVQDFADIFALELPKEELVTTVVDVSSRAGLGKRKKSLMLNEAGCKPELTHVHLNLPHEEGVFFTPTCVRLHRCGGCCIGNVLSCQPTSVEELDLQVLKVKVPKKVGSTRGASSGGGRRRPRRRRRNTGYINVKQLNHTSCDCECTVKEEHCDLNIHVYLRSECKCLCQNKDEERKCLKKNGTHFWNHKTCQCTCRDSHECSSGEFFNHKECRCVSPGASVVGRSGLTNPKTEDNTSGHYVDKIRRDFGINIPLRRNRKPVLLSERRILEIMGK